MRNCKRLYRGRGLRGRRGSTLLIVLGLLSVLVLLASTLAFTSRVEVMSSRNFGVAVQNRVAAATGAASASLMVSSFSEQDAAETREFLARVSEAAAWQAAGRKQTLPERNLPSTLRTDTAGASFLDASARLNLNTATEASLARLIARVAGAAVDSNGLAQRIVAWRLGPDGVPGSTGDDDFSAPTAFHPVRAQAVDPNGLPGFPTGVIRGTGCVLPDEDLSGLAKALATGVDDPGEFVSDIRRPAMGDDRRFYSPEDLHLIEEFPAPLIEALAPFVTAFSLAQQEWIDQDGKRHAPLDLNRATAEELYDALAKLYGSSRNDTLLRQFAVNLVDSRDEDHTPTSLDAPGTPEGVVLGLERAPLITEVYADSLSQDEQGDDGQYVELYNPWNEPISLSEYRLRVGGQSVTLNGELAPRGYLIVTDDYDNSTDADAEDEFNNEGSLYDLFGIVENGVSRRIEASETFSLANQGSGLRVDLVDERGALVDRFTYDVDENEDNEGTAYARRSPLVRESVAGQATPFGLPMGDPVAAAVIDRLRGLPLNRAFLSPVEVFDVFAGFAGSADSRWAFPAATVPVEPEEWQLDARILDLITIEWEPKRTAEAIAKAPRDGNGDGLMDRAADPYKGEPVASEANAEALAWKRYAEAPIGLRVGRVNVNTASEEVLESVGFTKAQAAELIQRRNDRLNGDRAPLFATMGEVLAADWLWDSAAKTEAADVCARLRLFAELAPQLTTGSQAFLVEAQRSETATSGGWKLDGVPFRGIVSFDGEEPQLVEWRFGQ
jgi:type II secretory pathway component PulK